MVGSRFVLPCCCGDSPIPIFDQMDRLTLLANMPLPNGEHFVRNLTTGGPWGANDPTPGSPSSAFGGFRNADNLDPTLPGVEDDLEFASQFPLRDPASGAQHFPDLSVFSRMDMFWLFYSKDTSDPGFPSSSNGNQVDQGEITAGPIQHHGTIEIKLLRLADTYPPFGQAATYANTISVPVSFDGPPIFWEVLDLDAADLRIADGAALMAEVLASPEYQANPLRIPRWEYHHQPGFQFWEVDPISGQAVSHRMPEGTFGLPEQSWLLDLRLRFFV